MQKASQMLLVVVSLLVSGFVLAEDAWTTASSHYAGLDSFGSRPLWQSPGVRWQPEGAPTIPIASVTNDPEYSLANLDFRDPGALARVSKLREVSLLTLAELGTARVFFGVNDRGLFGFHLGARPSPGDERCVELARMPYLQSDTDKRPSN